MTVNKASQRQAIKKALKSDTFNFASVLNGIIFSCTYTDVLDDGFYELLSVNDQNVFTVRNLDNNQLLTIEE